MLPISVPSLDFDLGRLHHIGVVVADIDAAAEHFAQVYGLEVSPAAESEYVCRIDGTAQATIQRIGLSVEGPPYLELLRAVPGSNVWQPSPGVHHLGFVVDDVALASRELARRGSPLWMGGLHGERCPVGTAYHRDQLGVTIELLDRGVEQKLSTRFSGESADAVPKPADD
ncbi:VOC family protein [Nocardia neocaledoniensis]|uniref:VOC family protein n=1 Tax=Nocardia neocaledoniensis TaxID=236511 RepID=UPI0024553257|nr:VOC family protein [Nocardia neocaledoniensis]